MITNEQLDTTLSLLLDGITALDYRVGRGYITPETDLAAIVNLFDMGLRDWQIARSLNLHDFEVDDVLIAAGRQPDSGYFPDELDIKRYASDFLLFNGADTLQLYLRIRNTNYHQIHLATGLPLDGLRYICTGRRIPTKEQLVRLCNYLGIDIDVFKSLSSDVYHVMNDNIPKLTLAPGGRNYEEMQSLGAWNKQITIRPALVFNRLRLGITLNKFCHLIGISHSVYSDIEKGYAIPDWTTATKIMELLGIKDRASLYYVDIVPLNYEHLYNEITIERAKRNKEYTLAQNSYYSKHIDEACRKEQATLRKDVITCQQINNARKQDRTLLQTLAQVKV